MVSCSMDDEGLCVTKNQTSLPMIAQDLAVPCLNTDCSNSTCNSAVQDVRVYLVCCLGFDVIDTLLLSNADIMLL